MSVLIQINGENAGEAIRELTALAGGITGQVAPAAPAAPAEAPKTSRSRNAAKSEPAKETLAASEPEEKEEPAGQEPEAAASDEPIPTDVELREIATKVGEKDPKRKPAIKALLNQYGVPNITAVPDDKRIAFKSELEGLLE